MVNMAQRDRQSLSFIVGKGNFGQATSRDLAPAAARYTEVKLSDVSVEALSQLNKNLVNWVPSYDGSIMIPEVLPVSFPWILTQASSGVAYGMASSIPSFNLKELTNAMIKFINEGKKILLIPDFSTKGYIVNNQEVFKKINLEGSGSVQVRGKAEVDGYSVLITEIPYSTTREAIIDKIVELSKDKLKEVAEVKDLTGLKGMSVRVRFKRGTDMKIALEKLYQLTSLQSSYSTNLNVLINGSPKVMGVWGVITEWLKWRKMTIQRGLNFDIAKLEKELHFLKGLEKVLLDIDAAIEIIRRSASDMIETNLMKKFNIDETQAKAVADMKLRNINEDYIINRIKDIQKLEDKIDDLKDLVRNDERLNQVIIKDLETARDKYGVDRQSKVIEVNTEKIKAVKKQMEEIPDYPVKLFVTREGYVKKMKLGYGEASDQYVKPGDEIVNEYSTFNRAEFLIFGNDKCCYKVKISDIEESSNRALGTFIKSLCDLSGSIVGTSIIDTLHEFIIISYDNNKVAKIKLDSFEGNRKKLANSLAKNAGVVGILTFKEEGKFIIKSANGEIELMTSGFELKERWTQGVFAARKGKPISIRKV
jgi:DNA gyrase subunit A